MHSVFGHALPSLLAIDALPDLSFRLGHLLPSTESPALRRVPNALLIPSIIHSASTMI